MTRTEDDLRTLLHTPVEPTAPPRVLARVVAGPRSAQRTRRTWRIGLVTALALVIVAGAVLAVVVVRPGSRTAPQPPVASTPAPTTSTGVVGPPAGTLPVGAFVARVDRSSGYFDEGVSSTVDAQTSDVLDNDVIVVATMVVTGASTPSDHAHPVAGRSPVAVPGGSTARWIAPAPGSASPPAGISLRWTTGPGYTVTISPGSPADSGAVVAAVAAATSIVTPVPVYVPASVSALPTGWTFAGVKVFAPYGHVIMQAGDIDVTATFDTPGPASSYGQVTGALIECAGLPFVGNFDFSGTPVVIAGRTWHWQPSRGELIWRGPDRVIRLGNGRASGFLGVASVTEDQLVALARSLVLAPSFDDTTTWFDATTAFPS